MSIQIQSLKNAIVQHDWEQCKILTNEIFVNSDIEAVANLTIAYVRIYKDRFAEQYPQQNLIIKRLVEMDAIMEREPEDIPIFPEYKIKLKEPLGRTFKWALYHIWSMARCREKSEFFSMHACDAIMRTRTVILYEYPNWIPNEFIYLYTKSYQDYRHKVWMDFVTKLMNLY